MTRLTQGAWSQRPLVTVYTLDSAVAARTKAQDINRLRRGELDARWFQREVKAGRAHIDVYVVVVRRIGVPV